MAFEKNKGMVAVLTNSGYKKFDPYIEASSLNITPDIVQERDSYRNANGALKRPSIMPCISSKIEFNIPFCDKETMDKAMSILNNGTRVQGGVPAENKLKVRFYNQKQKSYNEAWMYFPEIQFSTYTTAEGKVRYNPTRIAFISYGEKR